MNIMRNKTDKFITQLRQATHVEQHNTANYTNTRMHGKAEPDSRPVLFFTVCEPKYSTAIEN